MELNGFSKFNALQDSPLPQVHNKSGSSGSSSSDSIKNNFDGATNLLEIMDPLLLLLDLQASPLFCSCRRFLSILDPFILSP